jgi:hypothetical protein
MKSKYYPVFKTTIAEYKAFENLSSDVKDGILPICELTRSRITKKNLKGDVVKQAEKLNETMLGKPFVLDLTTEPSQTNIQIETMLKNYKNGFEHWTRFVKQNFRSNIIPMIHYNDDASDDDHAMQINQLLGYFNQVAFRIGIDDSDFKTYISFICKHVKNEEKLCLILDAQYIKVNEIERKKDLILNMMREIKKIPYAPKHVVLISSSYPKSVASEFDDIHAEFPLLEVQLFSKVCNNCKDIYYGDYACVHPIRYMVGGGHWVARIDYPLEDSLYYYRQRHEDYGVAYSLIAQQVKSDPRFKPFHKNVYSWGHNEINDASESAPNGRSPSHWIAVRSNIHMTRQWLRLKKNISG